MNNNDFDNKGTNRLQSKRYDIIKRYAITFLISLMITPNIFSQSSNNWTFDLYVTMTGSGTHSGIDLLNAMTIDEAISNAQAGDTIFIQKGLYNILSGTKNFNTSGTSGNPIVFYGEHITGYNPETANGTELAYFYCSSGTNGILSISGNYIELHSIATYQISGKQTYNISGDYVTLDSCVIITDPIVGTEHTIVVKPTAQHFTLSHSYILRSGRTAIWVEGDLSIAADNVIIEYNTFKGQSNHYSIQIMPITTLNPSATTPIDGAIIRNNLFIDNPYSEGSLLLRHCSNFKVYNNLFVNSGTILNMITPVPSSGDRDTCNTNGSIVAYNTVVDDTHDWWMFRNASGGQQLIVKNNLVLLNSPKSGGYAMDFRCFSPAEASILRHQFDYNSWAYKTTTVQSAAILWGCSSTDYRLNGTWTSSLGFDTHGIFNQVTSFVNTSSYDYTPIAGSAVINAGVSLSVYGITTDYNGNPRDPNNPTVGAFEFSNGGIDLTPPNLVEAVLNNPTSLTLNFSEQLNPSTAQNINNYSINNGITVTAAAVSGSQVTLSTSAHVSGNYVVNVNNVTDLAGNVVNPNNNSAQYSFQIDVTPPELIGASIIDSITLRLSFSEALDPNSGQNINNYSISNGISVLGANVSAATVTLSTSEHSTGSYTVTVNNVTDIAGNVISSQNNAQSYDYQSGGGDNLILLPVGSVIASVVPEPNHYPEKTVDGLGYYEGDPDSRWSGDTMPEWLVYDLGGVQVINQTRLSFYNWNVGRIYNYTLLVSTDNVNWNEVRTSVQSSLEEWSIEVLGSVEARYVKIIFVANNQNAWAGLWESEFWGHILNPTIIENEKISPTSFIMDQNYPNPFNPSTMIRVSIPKNTHIKLTVYNILGEFITELANGEYDSGVYEFNFDAAGLSSGMYLYRIESSDFIETKKMMVMK